jgi:hypothetical protein
VTWPKGPLSPSLQGQTHLKRPPKIYRKLLLSYCLVSREIR